MHELHTPIATLSHPNTQPQHQQQLNSNCNKNNYYCHKTNYGNNKRKNSAYNKSFRAINNNKRMNTNSGFSNHRRSFVDRQYSDVLMIRNSTQILEELLESKFQIMESLPQIQLREKVINLLDVCVSEWLKMEELKLKTCIPLHQFGRVLPFGSYFLGAHCVASDIDVVCLCPNIVTSEDFFTDFVDIAQQHGSLITNVKVVKDAHIPVIRMKINDIEVDLLFATLPVQFLSNNHLIFLRNNVDSMDFPSQKSIHGRLECEELMDLLPASLITKFQTVLRAVKFWAQRRGVYKSIYGYLGGFSFAILVAKLCLMFSDMEAGDIFANFFRVYSHWRWPNPVKLNMNSFYPVHFQEIMPIIGPVSPHKNTSHTVSLSTFSVMMAELQRADRILSSIATTPNILPQAGQSNTKTKDSEVNSTPWDEVFEPLDFGNMYNMYICISVESDSYEAHHLSVGFIESKIRYLILELEKYNIFPHVCPKYFSEIIRNKDTKPVYRSCFYLGLDIVKPDMDQLQEILQCGIDVLMSVYASNTLNMYLTPEISIVNKDHVLQSIKNQDSSAQIPISSNTQATTGDDTTMKIVE